MSAPAPASPVPALVPEVEPGFVPRRVSAYEGQLGANAVAPGPVEAEVEAAACESNGSSCKGTKSLKVALAVLFSGAIAFGVATAKGFITAALAVKLAPIALAVGVIGLTALSIDAVVNLIKNRKVESDEDLLVAPPVEDLPQPQAPALENNSVEGE
ncbi:MAG: hypothetical protein WDZ27_01365 [Waddliaceae bacterium]